MNTLAESPAFTAIPGVDLFELQSLPEDPRELPENREIPTRTFTAVELVGKATVRYTLEMPEEVLDPVPLGIAHGWFGMEGGYADLRHWVAQNGKPAVTVRPTRVVENLAGYHPAHLLHPERLLCQTMYGALKGIRKLREAEDMGLDASFGDLLGHSMGGRTAASIAQKRPDLVRSVTLVAAAGMEPHSVKDFVTNRIPNFIKYDVPSAAKNGHLRSYLRPSAALELVDYTCRGGMRTLREGISIGSCDIREIVQDLGDLDVKTAMLTYKADSMIPALASLEHSGNLVDVAALFPYRRVGHLGPQTHPEATGQAQLEILDALNGTNLAGKHHPGTNSVAA
jgi:pimeloyl-ACP methyl ester carboxylesterase